MVEILVLRVVHVLGGLFWVGSALFNSIFLMPSLMEAGPAAGAIMGGLQKRRLFTVLPVVALLTILSGLRLLWITSDGFDANYFATATGATFGASGTAAILAFILGMAVGRPANVRLGTLRQSLARTQDAAERAGMAAEVGRLQRRAGIVGWVVHTLLVLAAAGMALGRYVV